MLHLRGGDWQWREGLRSHGGRVTTHNQPVALREPAGPGAQELWKTRVGCTPLPRASQLRSGSRFCEQLEFHQKRTPPVGTPKAHGDALNPIRCSETPGEQAAEADCPQGTGRSCQLGKECPAGDQRWGCSAHCYPALFTPWGSVSQTNCTRPKARQSRDKRFSAMGPHLSRLVSCTPLQRPRAAGSGDHNMLWGCTEGSTTSSRK